MFRVQPSGEKAGINFFQEKRTSTVGSGDPRTLTSLLVGREELPHRSHVSVCIHHLGLPQQSTRLGGLNSTRLFSRSFGDWKFKMQVPAVLLSGGSAPLGLQTAGFSLCAHTLSSLYAQGERWQGWGGFFGVSSSKDRGPVGSGLHPYDLIQP